MKIEKSMELKNKRVSVLGAARSGIAAALFLKKEGAIVLVSDKKEDKLWINERKKLEGKGIETEAGGHSKRVLENTDLIVISPGIPLDVPVLAEARMSGIPVIGEIELGFAFCQAPIIAVGGTNGKTTTTTFLGMIFKQAGRSLVVAGNIGTPFIGETGNITPGHNVILEISSFQLETIVNFRPKISITLNISRDHFDRYSSSDEYYRAKAKMFLNQKENDYTILNYDDQKVAKLSQKTKSKVIFFSNKRPVPQGVYLEGEDIIFCLDGQKEKICSRREIKLPGEHNVSNILAAIAASKIDNIPNDAIIQVLKSFTGLKHRLELVREINGIKFYNDSKGTNADSVIKALESFDPPIILIAGGQDKNADFSTLCPFVKEKVRSLILIGEAKQKINKALEGLTEIIEENSLEDAVLKANALANEGDIVLFSPGCSSFDMFKNYEERGERYKEAVNNLKSFK